MQPLSTEEFDAMRSGATVLEEDRFGPKVLRLQDGNFLKLFRRKSWFSKALLFPPAKRFADHAQELTRRHIPCPKVLGLYEMRSPYRSVVLYEPLQGTTLRDLLASSSPDSNLETLVELATFITSLHDKGVYFRSLHLGNIVMTPDQQFGLIDIADMRCFDGPLSTRMRRRNYHHLLRYERDWANVDKQVKGLFS
ncbi:lipopolysaccharide kinase InaA family protein [Halopseudomonas pachastrellae]|uniref:lipopolysaccharide kinase InaA family protein n=1 Tax=Halopseudomonas pachastrellae TaxID=254161 RepID=UPI003D7E262A